MSINPTRGPESSGLTGIASTIKDLFAEWANVSGEIRALDRASDTGARSLAELIRRQNELVLQMVSRRAKSAEDAMYKLAIWRWSRFDDQLKTDHLSPVDALVYSAFTDLADANGRNDLVNAYPR